MQLHQQVASWRKAAEAKGINFFSFTLVREPISFAFSVYNDLCVMRGQCGGGLNAFMEMDWVNKQTQFLNTGWSKFYQGRRRSNRTEDMGPSESEAALLFTKMKSILDWVGPSECLVNDTIPLLKYYIPSIGVDNFSSSNVVKKDLDGILYKSMLSHNELDYLHSIMRLDTMLYQNVVNHYGSSCFACASPVSSFSGPWLLDPDAIINKSPEKVVGRRHPKEEIYKVLTSIVNYISIITIVCLSWVKNQLLLRNRLFTLSWLSTKSVIGTNLYANLNLFATCSPHFSASRSRPEVWMSSIAASPLSDHFGLSHVDKINYFHKCTGVGRDANPVVTVVSAQHGTYILLRTAKCMMLR